MLALQLACGGWIAAAVGAVAQLGVADLLEERSHTAGELASATGTVEPVLLRVMTLLSALGLFESTGDGRFRNTDESRVLCSDHPRSMRHFCMLAAGEYQSAFGALIHTLETGESAFPTVFDGSIYDYMDREPERGGVYDRAMEDLARPVGGLLAAARDYTGVGRVVDVGGGTGTVLKGLLSCVPHLQGVCTDRSDVCARGAEALRIEAPELVGRLSFEVADFFQGVPPGGDLYLLKNVLHNWNDDGATRILQCVRDAMHGVPGARLVVIEPLSPEEAPSTYQAMDDLMQSVICESGTQTRSEEEMNRLLARASFSPIGVDSIATGHSLVEAAAGT